MANQEEAPIVQMGEKKEKPTYEELQRELMNTVGKCKELYMQLQQANLFNLYKQLEFNFKVIEMSDKFDTEFVERNKIEIMKIMATVGKNPEVDETNKEGE